MKSPRSGGMPYYSRDVQLPGPGSENSRLHGTGRVADDLYLIAHHEATGRPYLSPRATGIALAGGLLAELLTAETQAITLEHGRIVPLYRRNGQPVARYVRPDEPVSGYVLHQIVSESLSQPVREWLLFLGRTAASDVAARLQGAGYLTRPVSRRLRPTRCPVPVDGDWSQCALLRAAATLDTARTPAPYTWLLSGLTVACGLGFRFSGFPNGPARGGEASRALTRPLQELIAYVQATADAAVLSTRM